MKKQRLLSLFLCFSLLASLAMTSFASAYVPIDVEAKAALLVEAETGEILYEKNIMQENYPASLTKIMVALLVLEAIDAGRLTMATPVTASESAFVGLVAGGSTANIKAGETMTVEDLLYCMLVVSANEACNILAETVSGSVDAFVARMNERAQELGCKHTHFMNPSGLHDPQHYSTAWDLYLITVEALRHEQFMVICNSKSREIAATNVSDKRTLHSTNYLISNWRARGYLYNGAQGIKTGSTSEAGYCLISSALRGSRRLLSVVLGAERVQQSDGYIITKSFSETSRLFDWGFDNFVSKRIIAESDPICEVPVALSGQANYVVVHPANDLTRMVPDDLNVEALQRDIRLYSESVDAPIAAGDELGTLTLSDGEKVYGEVALLALSDVSASWVLIAQRNVKNFFAKTWVKLACLGIVLLILALIILRRILSSRSRRYGGRRRGRSRSSGYRGRRR